MIAQAKFQFMTPQEYLEEEADNSLSYLKRDRLSKSTNM